MEMYLHDNNTVTLELLPVCECGYVFRDGIIFHEEISEINKWKYSQWLFEPAKCPKCQRIIDGIKYNYNLIKERE